MFTWGILSGAMAFVQGEWSFDMVSVMTQGGPQQSTVSVLYFMYEEGFKWWNLGFASAIAFILYLLMFAVTMLQLYVSRRREAT